MKLEIITVNNLLDSKLPINLIIQEAFMYKLMNMDIEQ